MKVSIPEIVQATCQGTNIKPELIGAIIYEESKGYIRSSRYEKHIHEKLFQFPSLGGFVPNPNVCSLATEKVNRSCSWGLCHILGETARTILHVKVDNLTEIQDPELNIQLCVEYLSHLFEEYSGMDKSAQEIIAVRRYNGVGQDAKAYGLRIFDHIKMKRYVPFTEIV